MQSELSQAVAPADDQTFVEGLDFYFEDGRMVLTRRYLLHRGYCCDNQCRHCPYREDEVPLE